MFLGMASSGSDTVLVRNPSVSACDRILAQEPSARDKVLSEILLSLGLLLCNAMASLIELTYKSIKQLLNQRVLHNSGTEIGVLPLLALFMFR